MSSFEKFEQKPNNFSKEKFLTACTKQLGEYVLNINKLKQLKRNTFDDNNETFEEYSIRTESKKKEIAEEAEKLINELITLSIFALGQSNDKNEILNIISDNFDELFEIENSGFEENRFLRRVILELLSSEQKR